MEFRDVYLAVRGSLDIADQAFNFLHGGLDEFRIIIHHPAHHAHIRGFFRFDGPGQTDHLMEHCSALGPLSIGHNTPPDSRQDAECDFRKLEKGVFGGHHAVTPQGYFQSPAKGHPVEGRHNGLFHVVHEYLHFGTVLCIFGRRLPVTQGFGEFPYVRTC